jgi:hypothetical protein
MILHRFLTYFLTECVKKHYFDFRFLTGGTEYSVSAEYSADTFGRYFRPILSAETTFGRTLLYDEQELYASMHCQVQTPTQVAK